MRTNITVEELKNMEDNEIISHGKKFPYESQWEDKKAIGWFKYHLSLKTGRKYVKTGNRAVFNQPLQ